MNNNTAPYVIVTPVKDEEKYINATLQSIILQTVKPLMWVIVDDGSTDNTVNIIGNYTKANGWIKLIDSKNFNKRNTGKAEILAFYSGYKALDSLDYSFIVKLDADLSLPENYFEKILDEFSKDEKLGIASGVYLENRGRGWMPVEMPSYHTPGACKTIRKECFNEIGGFLPTPGYDTVDEIKAWYLGWKTRHFKDILFYHLKNEGSGMGIIRTNIMHGEVFYLTGGRPLFFLIKFIRRFLGGTPPVLAGIIMLYGYLRLMVRREKLLVNEGEANCYNELLAKRFSETLKLNALRKIWS